MLPLTLTLGAGLVFLVQPIIAATLLPWFGGVPAVWTTSLMFFQCALLAGYAWAWWLARLPPGRAVALHLWALALSLAALPITPALSARPPDPEAPVLRVLALLVTHVGLPYTLLAATAPLVQARAAALARARPYRLYAWSNAGSLAAILAHPLLLDVRFGARALAQGWSVAYAGFVVLIALALWPQRHAAAPAAAGGPAPARGDRARWLALSAAGAALLVSVSAAIAQDLSVNPLLWVLPLGLYLLTFIVAFAAPAAWPRRLGLPLCFLALALLTALLAVGYQAPWWAHLGGYCLGLFLACLHLHAELVRAQPGPAHLTGYYLWLAGGGALGGALAGVVGPALLPLPVELPLACLGCLAVAGRIWLGGLPPTAPREGRRLLLLGFSLALGLGLAWPVGSQLARGGARWRSFFGTLWVRDFVPAKASAALRHLLDGRISHGFQWLDPARRREPTAYFVPHSGVGRLLSLPGGPRHVGVIGLGAGTLAAYGRPGDRMSFYEINPAVLAVARSHFSFLADSPAEIQVAAGDGRTLLEHLPPQGFSALVVDAFSGDAIPTHLITAEAVAVYLGHLAQGGVLAVNVSNRHADLSRVMRQHAADQGLAWIFIAARARSPLGPYVSHWMLLSRDPTALAAPALAEAAGPPPRADRSPVRWRDDHAPVWAILR